MMQKHGFDCSDSLSFVPNVYFSLIRRSLRPAIYVGLKPQIERQQAEGEEDASGIQAEGKCRESMRACCAPSCARVGHSGATVPPLRLLSPELHRVACCSACLRSFVAA